ncbi:MAG: hypothetical protein LEGION0398_MBIBDBAK_00394 [Legionellaceae bacterium]
MIRLLWLSLLGISTNAYSINIKLISAIQTIDKNTTLLTILSLVAFIICLIIYFILKRKVFQNISNHEFKRWLSISFIAAKSPFFLLLLSYFLYFLLKPFFYPLLVAEDKNTIEIYIQYFLSLMKLISFFWFTFRFLKLISSELINIAKNSQSKTGEIIANFLSENFKYIVFLVTFYILIPLLPIDKILQNYLFKILQLSFIGILAWLGLEINTMFEKTILEHYKISDKNNLHARKIYTQTKVIKKIITIIILFFTLAATLMTFENVRQYGTSLLASAGLLTAIVGFAAQRSLASIVAGLQIAISQPIRIDDAVIVENEFGFIEEISLSYVVIRLWDKRRLILPVNYFIEKPFQNWTRHSTDLIGIIFLYVDYTLPIDQLRQEFKRILNESSLWNGETAIIHLSDSKERTMELRILVSAANAGNTWDLRCEVREKLITFIQKHYPESLPKLRIGNQTAENTDFEKTS